MSEGQGVIWSPAPNIGSGIYFVKIQSGGKNYSEKIIFIK
jgi:fibronectin type 3 domain-containing protein